MNLLSASLLLLISLAVHATKIRCPSSEETDFQITVISRRNKTGHWIAEVKMDHDGSGSADSGPWELKVQQSTLTGYESKTVRIEINAVAPPRSSWIPYGNDDLSIFDFYKLHTTPSTWDEARITCERKGEHLIVLDSEAKREVVKAIIRNSKQEDVYRQSFWTAGERIPVDFDSYLDMCHYINAMGVSENALCINKFFFFCER